MELSLLQIEIKILPFGFWHLNFNGCDRTILVSFWNSLGFFGLGIGINHKRWRLTEGYPVLSRWYPRAASIGINLEHSIIVGSATCNRTLFA